VQHVGKAGKGQEKRWVNSSTHHGRNQRTGARRYEAQRNKVKGNHPNQAKKKEKGTNEKQENRAEQTQTDNYKHRPKTR